jgi:hypothetical protein
MSKPFGGIDFLIDVAAIGARGSMVGNRPEVPAVAIVGLQRYLPPAGECGLGSICTVAV